MELSTRLKDKLRAGDVVIGTFVSMPSPEVAEICALAGFDFILLDAEHGRINEESAFPLVLAAEAHGVSTIARVGQNDRQVILKYLDLGIGGVMIPQVSTPEAAEAAVAAMKYAPRGVRGLAGGRTFHYGVGRPPQELVPLLNDRLLTIVQFEHIDALDHLDGILATPELDMLFVGPNDLAQSMNLAGQMDHPDVQSVIDRVVATAKGGPVALGTVAADARSTNRQLERGFQLIASSAAGLLMGASRQLLSGVKRPS